MKGFVIFIVIYLLVKGGLYARRHAMHYPGETIAYVVWKIALGLGQLALLILLILFASRSSGWLIEQSHAWLMPP